MAGYWALPWHKARLGWLLVASWLFYAAWYPAYLVLFLLVSVINYLAGLAVGATRTSRPGLARWIVIGTAIVDLGNLAFFKYANFLVQSTAGAFVFLTGSEWSPPMMDIFLPLGISFYSFQMMAYVIDTHRGTCQTIRNPLKMFLFIAFFPQLIAGPIVRANELIGQLSTKQRFRADHFLRGLDLIIVGAFKKVIIADQLAPFVDKIYAAPQGLGTGALMLGVYAYAIQIYCDFSGYTDIGRGCARCLGYKLPRNFTRPYLACNIAEFWRRWHMTLSSWLRDYLYIPLGGNRQSVWRTHLNLMITMTLGGLWHGASWCFVVWGMIHGIALSVSRIVHTKLGVKPDEPLLKSPLYRFVSTVATFHLVALAWVFFRAPTFDTAFTIIRQIFSFRLLGATDLAALGMVLPGLIFFAVVFLVLLHLLASRAERAGLHRGRLWTVGRPVLYFIVIAAIMLCAGRGPQQFIYFQF